MDLEAKIREKCELLRPALQADGGDLEFVKIDPEEKTVYVRLKGACAGCPFSLLTLKDFVEKQLREVWPEIKAVVPER